MERTTHLLTPASLKALAHPVRVELLGLLRAHGPATASGLAERLGESSGTTSYHLRQLAAAGFVADVPERGNGRERWWRAAQDSTRLETDQMDDDPQTRAAEDVYLQAVTRASDAKRDEWLAARRELPRSWRGIGTVNDYQLSLGPAELQRLNDEVEALIESYRRDPKRGDRQVVVQYNAFPRRES